jgi:tRNA (guanine26-N2/guanine27-N2)-dimethyltransferase
MDIVTEGKAIIKIKTSKIVSKDMPVFYNPVMELNRTLSVLLLNALDKKEMRIGLPLEASGLRGIRFLKELKKGKIKSIHLNDYDETAVNSMKENIALNKILLEEKIIISQNDANLFLLNSNGFDYIDIDPFGTPNPFLDSAVKRISRDGILAVTATDTAALSGTYPDACARKYWAVPLRNEIMHEVGLRILIRKCQLVAAQFEKALTPIYSYSDEHYMRIFFLCKKGKKNVDEVLVRHGLYLGAGPLWLGELWDERLAEKIANAYSKPVDKEKLGEREKEWFRILQIIKAEAKIKTLGFYNLPALAKKHKFRYLPKREKIFDKVLEKGYNISETHFSKNSLRTDIPEDELVSIIKSLVD